MKTLSKKTIAVILAVMTLVSVFTMTATTADAANQTTDYASFATPSSSDYAYWNGSKMVKASGTTASEVKWMQAVLNYFIKNKGLKASLLDVDGSFGPASKKTTTAFQKKYNLTQDGSFGKNTIAKAKSLLPSSQPIPPKNKSKISADDIQKVLNKYNYVSGRYWTYAKGGSATKGFQSTTRKGRKYSYKYNGVECYGFANFVMHEVTGTAVNPNNGNKNGWKYIKAGDVKELKVGDIVRIGKSNSNGHSGVVMSVNSGKCTFAQVFGGVDNKISIGKGLASSSFGTHSTLKSMKDSKVLLYVYRYVG